MGVFKKYLKEQLGKSRYASYVQMCEEDRQLKSDGLGMKPEHLEKHQTFQAMYGQLREESVENIEKRREKFSQAVYAAQLIKRKFASIVIFYAVANAALLSMRLDYTVTCVSVMLMGICFIYKLIEFLSNKYCIVDIYLMAIYKTVLEKLLISK